MRRAILVFVLGVCVFGAAAWVGFYAASQLAPERLRSEAESRLSALLKAPVRLGEVKVSITDDLPWLHLEARTLRADPLPRGAALSVDEVTARIDPILLAFGRLELRELRFSGIDLSLPEPNGEGSEGCSDPASRAVALLSAAADRLRARPCPIPAFVGEGLSLSLTSAAAPRRVLELDSLTFSCATLSAEGTWQAEGRALLAERVSAPFTLSLQVTEAAVDARLGVESAPLGALLEAFRQPPELGGSLRGNLTWRAQAGHPHSLHLALSGRGVKGELGAARDPQRALQLDLAAPEIALELAASEREIRAMKLLASDGKVALEGSLALGLPFSDASALRAEAHTREIGLAELARIAAHLPSGARPDVERALERLEGGLIRELSVRLDSTVGGAREIAAGGLLARASDVGIDLTLEDARVRIGESDQLDDASVRVAFSGDALELQAASARFRERRLPRIELRLRGISQIRSLQDVRCDRPGPIPPLAAIDDLRAWVESRRRPPYKPSWRSLSLDIERLSHPLLFCTAENVAAQIERLDNGYDFAIESGVWAGFGIEGTATYKKPRGSEGRPARDGGSVRADLALGERASAAAPAADPSVWAEGRFALDVSWMGRFLTKSYEGAFRAIGATADLYDTKLRLSPAGELEGRVTVDLGADGPVPFTVDAQSRGIELLDVWKISQAPQTFVSGTLTGGASLAGRLHLSESPLVDASGYASLHARKGEIYRNVPFLFAVAMTDERINPFGKRDRFPYRAIDLEGPIEAGWMTSRTLTLEGKSERMAASGKTHLAEPYELEAAIGVYPIPTLDSIIGAIPIVNVLLLGEDRALAGFYFSVSGEWTKPKVQPLLAKSVASGPASLVLEGVPNFLFGSLKAIGEVLTPPSARPEVPAQEEAPPSAPPAGSPAPKQPPEVAADGAPGPV